MSKLERLIDLAIAWLEIQVGDRTGQRTEDAAAATDKPPKTRSKKAEKVADAVPPTPPATEPAGQATADAPPESTDKETYDELTRLAALFIGPNTPGADERRAKAVKHVTDTYKVDQLSKVPHGPQRAQLIGWFKDQLVEKQQKAAAAAAAPSGFGV